MKKSTSARIGASVIGVALVIGLICLISCITKIPVGYEGVVYSISGGVQDKVLTQGWHLVSPMKKVKTFTISNEQLILSQDKRDGSPTDESFKVSTSDNASLAISFQMSYRFIPDQVVSTYKSYKGMDGEDIVSSRVRTVLKSKISEVTTNYSMMDIYSGNRSKINEQITAYLNENFSKAYGIEVIDASIIDAHPDEQLKQAIESRVQALQKKEQAQAEQETAKVEAGTALIKAQNEADIKKKKAEGEAAATKIAAEAQAEANKKISSSITDKIIEDKLADARKEHGWITVQGASTVVTKE